MRNVGEILKKKRISNNINLSRAAIDTKIRLSLLQKIEDNKFHQIAEGTVVKGLIKNYAEYLGLSSAEILAIFRRDYLEDKKGQILLRGSYEPLNKKIITWNPKLTTILGFILVILVFSLYFAGQIISLVGLPKLKITSPVNGAVVYSDNVEVKGKTEVDNVAYINDDIVSVDSSGNFLKNISLVDGENQIIIKIISRKGKENLKILIINKEIKN